MSIEHLSDLFTARSEELQQEFITIRRHLHKYPELSFEEYETSNFIAKKLEEFGIKYERVGDTGIKAVIEGEQENLSAKFTVALRADIDALPIKEETGEPYSSVYEGIMHACGHDGHTTILLGAARMLHEYRKHFNGKVVCIFQPGEEADGAAKRMIELGVLENPKVDRMVALHLWPYIPFGSIGIRNGSMTASCDDFTIEVYGKSGHSARPHEGVDSINIAMKIIQAIEHLVMKMNNPLNPIVVHVGKITGGTARNVIAEKTVLEGTSRALTEENRTMLKREITRISKQIAEVFHAQADVHFMDGNAPVLNDETVTSIVEEAAIELWGKEKVVELDQPSLGADDFGDFSLIVPSTYFRLGIEKDGEEVYSLHHPKFNFDDTLLSTGVATFAYTAVKLLECSEK
mgnify:CR=1 FL=1